MKKLKVKLDKPVMLHVTFYAEGTAVLAIKGKEKAKSNTPYFDRRYGTANKPICGRATVKFPMPEKFETLGLQVSNVLNSSAVKIEKIVAEELPQSELQVKQSTKDFIKFASDFARKLGTLPTDKYMSKDGQFQIHLVDQIRDHKTGEIIPTPARVNHMSGIIEVSKTIV